MYLFCLFYVMGHRGKSHIKMGLLVTDDPRRQVPRRASGPFDVSHEGRLQGLSIVLSASDGADCAT